MIAATIIGASVISYVVIAQLTAAWRVRHTSENSLLYCNRYRDMGEDDAMAGIFWPIYWLHLAEPFAGWIWHMASWPFRRMMQAKIPKAKINK